MALTYRNTLKGHIVSVPEPADILTAAEAEAEVLARKGTKRDRHDAELVMDRAQSTAGQQRQTLTKMDQSRRWERYTAPPVVAAPEPAPAPAPEPVPAEPAPSPAPAAPVKAAKATKAAAPKAPEPAEA